MASSKELLDRIVNELHSMGCSTMDIQSESAIALSK